MNSKQSVNISTVPKKDAKKSEVTEKGDITKESDDNLKGETINEVSSPNIKADDNLELKTDAESNGQVVPVLKVEDVEVTGEEEEGDKEVPKPTMSKVASMKRDLSFGRLQKMFSREPKSESQQDSSSGKAAELEPSPVPEVSATDEKMIKAEEAMGEEVTSEEVKSEEAKGDEEAKGEDIESRVTGLKKSLMKMFARESESEGATETLAGTAAASTEKEGDEEKGDGKEGTPAKMTSLKKRLSFKAMRSKFSKEKKEAGSVEDNDEEEKEAKGKENAKTEGNKKEGDEEEGEEKEQSTVKTSSLKKRLSFKAIRGKFSKEKKEADAGEDNPEEKKESETEDEKKDIEKKENCETEDEKQEVEAPSLVKDNCFKAMKSKFSKDKKEADAGEENNDEEKEKAKTEDDEREEVAADEIKQELEAPSLMKDNCFKAMKSKFSKEKKEVNASEETNEKKENVEKEDDEKEEVAAVIEMKQEVETPAHADAKVVNQEEGEAESKEEPTSSTVAATALPEELTQSYADAVKQPEILARVLVGSKEGQPELESSSESKMM